MNKDIFDELKKYCSHGYVTRKELKKLTGGLICGRTMAILDQTGKGIENREKIGKRTIYYIDDVINWLKKNTELIGFEEEKPVKKSQPSIDELLLVKKRVKRRT